MEAVGWEVEQGVKAHKDRQAMPSGMQHVLEMAASKVSSVLLSVRLVIWTSIDAVGEVGGLSCRAACEEQESEFFTRDDPSWWSQYISKGETFHVRSKERIFQR